MFLYQWWRAGVSSWVNDVFFSLVLAVAAWYNTVSFPSSKFLYSWSLAPRFLLSGVCLYFHENNDTESARLDHPDRNLPRVSTTVGYVLPVSRNHISRNHISKKASTVASLVYPPSHLHRRPSIHFLSQPLSSVVVPDSLVKDHYPGVL